MLQGETLDFVINRRSTNSYDATYFNPTIVLTGSVHDTTPPVISSVTAYVTPSSALISWMTDEPSNAQVEYGLTAALGTSSFLVQIFRVDHTLDAPITISNLSPGTLYRFRVRSADAAGNVAVSGNFTFTSTPTLPPGAEILGFRVTSRWCRGPGAGPTKIRMARSTRIPLKPSTPRMATPGRTATPYISGPMRGAPGLSAGPESQRWTAPRDGTAQVTGITFANHPAETLGVEVLIRRGSTTLWQYTFTTGDDSDQVYDVTVDIRAGDTLDFMTNRQGDSTSDSTLLQPDDRARARHDPTGPVDGRGIEYHQHECGRVLGEQRAERQPGGVRADGELRLDHAAE